MASEIETGTKYIPEMTETEIEELGGSIKASSMKVIEDNTDLFNEVIER